MKSSRILKRKNDPLDSASITHKKVKLESTITPDIKAKRKQVMKLEKVLDLSAMTLQKGMIVLGCVRTINNCELKINLPGRIVGIIPSTNVSEEYSSYLKLLSGENKEILELNNMFKPGQAVVTKVEEIGKVDENIEVKLTLNPSIIQDNLSVSDVGKGVILAASVQSIEKHVYVMNCGIPSVRAVLKKSQASNFAEIWNDGRPLGIGQVLRCVVIKCTKAHGFLNVELSADPETVSMTEVQGSDVPLTSVILGMCFQMSVAKVCRSFLIVNIMDNQTGYVHSNYLNEDIGEIAENSLLQGRVLYIEPLTKKIFLSALKNVCGLYPPPSPFENIQKGTKFEKAKVISSSGVVLLELEEDSDIYGYVTFQQTKFCDGMTEIDLVKIKEQYPKGSFWKCQILDYDYMLQKYICTSERKTRNKKYSSFDDITVGAVMKCIVSKVTPKGLYLNVDAIYGFVQAMHCTDIPVKNVEQFFQRGQKVYAKVLNVTNTLCAFTLKPMLVHSQNPILTTFWDAECGVDYDGVIVNINEKGVLITCYGNFKTHVHASKLLDWEPDKQNELFYIGQVVKCNFSIRDNRKELTIQPSEAVNVKNREEEAPLKVGNPYIVYVNDASPEGLIVQEHASGVTGIIPPTQLTDCPRMASMLCQSFRTGDALGTYCLSCEDEVIFTASPTFVKYFESSYGKYLVKKGVSHIEIDMVLPSRVTKINPDELIVSIPMQREECNVSVKCKNLCDKTKKDVETLGIETHQTLMVRIGSIMGSAVHGSCNLSRVCNKAMMNESGLMLVQDYVKTQKRIHCFWKSVGHPLGMLEIGSQVKGKVIAVTELGAVVDLLNGARAVVMPAHFNKDLPLEANMLVEGTAIFLDIVNQCVEITLLKQVKDMFSSLGKVPYDKKQSSCSVLVSKPDILVCGINYVPSGFDIAYVPSRWHINDFSPSPYYPVGITASIFVKPRDGLILAVPRDVHGFERKYRKETGVSILLKKQSENKIEIVEGSTESVSKQGDVYSKNMSIESLENGQKNNIDKSVTNENLTTEVSCKKQKKYSGIDELLSLEGSTNLTQFVKPTANNEKKRQKKKKLNKIYEGSKKEENEDELEKQETKHLNVSAGFAWNATPDQLSAVMKHKTERADSSSEDEVEMPMNKKTKQRLTMAEKRELARQEEERLRMMEERLMDAERNPVSADDFDRLVMSAPNDSQNWIKYMAYHLEATEVGKARAVAQQALKTISFRDEQDKLNVWMALLNLENLYGTQETLDKAVEEAVKVNEPHKIHMQMVNMYSITRKIEELNKMVQLVTKKYKDNKNIWIEVGLACIKCGEIEKSRQLMQRALTVLDKRDHIEVLTRFARMENDWGEPERAETIMENILTSYPKRCDVWNVYIDMLVKSKKIDIARQVLDRAVIQKLPVSKMKSLFKKYLSFEQGHGTPESVEKVREMAKNYVQNLNL